MLPIHEVPTPNLVRSTSNILLPARRSMIVPTVWAPIHKMMQIHANHGRHTVHNLYNWMKTWIGRNIREVVFCSVAVPGCLSRIPDTCFCTSNLKKIFLQVKKKNWANSLKKNHSTFYSKNCHYAVKYGLGIRDREKTYFGSRIQGSKWHWILDPDPQH